jgi:glyoxylase-like metal-dependent hydrolase (beta-lactamase superfamily II)
LEIIRIDSIATAFIRTVEGVNAGLIHTPKGMILIDTTSSATEIKALFEAAEVCLEEVRLVINTHFHSDHTWGNQVFTCPILAHRSCLERMQANLKNEWSPETLKSYLSDLERTDPQKADDFRKTVKDLHHMPQSLMSFTIGWVKYQSSIWGFPRFVRGLVARCGTFAST